LSFARQQPELSHQRLKNYKQESSEKGFPITPPHAHFDYFFKGFARSTYRGLPLRTKPHENYIPVTKCARFAVVSTFDLMEVLKKALEYSSDC